MTRKHFEALASMIRDQKHYGTITEDEAKTFAIMLVQVCRRFNFRFDGQKFMNACGIEK